MKTFLIEFSLEKTKQIKLIEVLTSLRMIMCFLWNNVEQQKWRMVRVPHDQINSSDYSYLVCGYPSNYVRFVSFCLETGSDLLLYIYEGVRPINNPRTHFNRTDYFIYHSLIIHAI
jgi:hypothetical protein